MLQNSASSIVGGLQFKKISVVMDQMGQQVRLAGIILQYNKPFIAMEMQIGKRKVQRIFNENIIREIVPEQVVD